MLEPILIVGIVIAATAWYVQHKWRKRLRKLAMRDPRAGTVLEVLATRYARGEIDRDEYLQKRSDILGYPGMPPTCEGRATRPCILPRVRLSSARRRATGDAGTETRHDRQHGYTRGQQ